MSTLKVVNIQHPSAASATLILDSSGNLALPAGSASTPALQGPSDTNTGLFFPAADTIAFTEGGTEALRIDSSGRVGIGTSSPARLLEVRSADDVLIKAVSTDPGAYVEFADNNTTQDVRLGAIGNAICFDVNSERMRIDSSGRVGIGTTSPQSALNLGDTSAESGIQLGDGADFTIKRNVASLGVQFNVGSDLNNYQFNLGGTERARIDSSGRLLINTSTSTCGSGGAAIQQIAGTNGGGDIHLGIFEFNNNTDGAEINLGSSRGTSVGSFTVVQNGDTLGRIRFVGADGTNMSSRGAQIEAIVDGTPGSGDMPGRLVFSTTADGASSPTERMRIGSDGRTNILDASTEGFASRSTSGASSSLNLYSGWHSATTVLNGTAVYVVRTNGNVLNTNGSYTTLSDVKLKENIADASSQWADIKGIKIRNWNFKEETGYETHRQIGPIAQELETVCPGLVSESPDRDFDGNDLGTTTKSVNQSVLYMKAVKALQEAMERIEQLEAEMAEVKAQLS